MLAIVAIVSMQFLCIPALLIQKVSPIFPMREGFAIKSMSSCLVEPMVGQFPFLNDDYIELTLLILTRTRVIEKGSNSQGANAKPPKPDTI